jgi:hypothetical protein
MKILMTTLAAICLLTACHRGSAEIEGDGYSIRTDSGGNYGSPARHCPPGHAKKGWC